jgi:hypothetical protein
VRFLTQPELNLVSPIYHAHIPNMLFTKTISNHKLVLSCQISPDNRDKLHDTTFFQLNTRLSAIFSETIIHLKIMNHQLKTEVTFTGLQFK